MNNYKESFQSIPNSKLLEIINSENGVYDTQAKEAALKEQLDRSKFTEKLRNLNDEELQSYTSNFKNNLIKSELIYQELKSRNLIPHQEIKSRNLITHLIFLLKLFVVISLFGAIIICSNSEIKTLEIKLPLCILILIECTVLLSIAELLEFIKSDKKHKV